MSKELMNKKDLDRALTRMAHEIIEKNKGTSRLCLIGIQRGGVLTYVGLCIASIGIIIYAENQKLIPVYVPDAPELPLFLSVSLILLSAAFISRFITESLQNNIGKSRQYAQDLANQKAMLDRVGQAVVGCGVDDTIIYWNHAAVDLYGWKAEEVIGRKYYDVVSTQLSPEMVEGIQVALSRGEVWSGELIVQRRDQNSLTSSWNCVCAA